MGIAFPYVRGFHGFLPFTFVGVGQSLHFHIQFSGDTQGVIDDHIFKVGNASFQFFQPSSRTGQRRGGLDVVHQEAINIFSRHFLVHFFGQQFCMFGIGTTVTTDIDVPSAFDSNKSKVFGTGLCTFTDTARYPAFHFMGGADTFVSVLDVDGKTDTFVHAVAAPGGTDTTFYRAERFSIRVTTFETLMDKFLPNQGKFMQLRPEHIDSLAAGYFGIQVVFHTDSSQGHELLWSNFSTRDPRHYGIGAIALNVGQVTVVTVLYGFLSVGRFVVDAGKNGRYSRFTYLAAMT